MLVRLPARPPPTASTLPRLAPGHGMSAMDRDGRDDVAVRRDSTFYVAPHTIFRSQEIAMLFHHFTEQESRAWIDAFIALVRLPPVQTSWGQI